MSKIKAPSTHFRETRCNKVFKDIKASAVPDKEVVIAKKNKLFRVKTKRKENAHEIGHVHAAKIVITVIKSITDIKLQLSKLKVSRTETKKIKLILHALDKIKNTLSSVNFARNVKSKQSQSEIKKRNHPEPIGFAKDTFKVPQSFFVNMELIESRPKTTKKSFKRKRKMETKRLQNEKITELKDMSKNDRKRYIASRGIDVLHNRQNFNHWLRTPNIALGRKKPASLMKTIKGAQMVVDLLGRIEHGVIS